MEFLLLKKLKLNQKDYSTFWNSPGMHTYASGRADQLRRIVVEIWMGMENNEEDRFTGETIPASGQKGILDIFFSTTNGENTCKEELLAAGGIESNQRGITVQEHSPCCGIRALSDEWHSSPLQQHESLQSHDRVKKANVLPAVQYRIIPNTAVSLKKQCFVSDIILILFRNIPYFIAVKYIFRRLYGSISDIFFCLHKER